MSSRTLLLFRCYSFALCHTIVLFPLDALLGSTIIGPNQGLHQGSFRRLWELPWRSSERVQAVFVALLPTSSPWFNKALSLRLSSNRAKRWRNTGTPTAGEVRASRAMQDCVDCGLIRPATVLLAGRSSTYGWKSTIWVGCPDLILEIDCISIIVVPCTVADSLGHILFTASGLQAWWLFLNPTATEALEFPTHVCFACSSLGFTFRGRARDEAHDAQRAQKRERTTETTRTKHYTTCDFMLAFGMTRAQTFFTPVRCWRMMETAILEKTIIKSLGVSFMLAGIRQNYSIEGLPGFGCT